jgi:hypothetical protein
MLKASALYMVIVIALVIGLLCSSLIVAAYFYKAEYQKKFRYDRLSNNINSGVNILLANTDSAYSKGKTFSLFGNDADSVTLQRNPWGIYDLGVARAFIGKDTLYKTFTFANDIDSSKWAAFYIVDEDRPLSLSGKTLVRGNAYVPKGKVNTAYVNGNSYTGDKQLIIGIQRNSEKMLPDLQTNRLSDLRRLSTAVHPLDTILDGVDSLHTSFLSQTRNINFGKTPKIFTNINLSGNIILFSDTSLVIDSTVKLDNVIVIAKSIIVKSGFHGNCQLFAIDSISIGSNCTFNYPSCLGLFRFKPPLINSQGIIHLGNKSSFGGIILTYEKKENERQPIIELGNEVNIVGQIYSQGMFVTMDNDVIKGSVYTKSYYYKSSATLFENYLINISIDSKALSQYYLTSTIMPVAGKKKKVLQWLEGN